MKYFPNKCGIVVFIVATMIFIVSCALNNDDHRVDVGLTVINNHYIDVIHIRVTANDNNRTVLFNNNVGISAEGGTENINVRMNVLNGPNDQPWLQGNVHVTFGNDEIVETFLNSARRPNFTVNVSSSGINIW